VARRRRRLHIIPSSAGSISACRCTPWRGCRRCRPRGRRCTRRASGSRTRRASGSARTRSRLLAVALLGEHLLADPAVLAVVVGLTGPRTHRALEHVGRRQLAGAAVVAREALLASRAPPCCSRRRRSHTRPPAPSSSSAYTQSRSLQLSAGNVTTLLSGGSTSPWLQGAPTSPFGQAVSSGTRSMAPSNVAAVRRRAGVRVACMWDLGLGGRKGPPSYTPRP
jgi:hypothetical protein